MTTMECYFCFVDLNGIKFHIYEPEDDEDIGQMTICIPCCKEHEFGCPDEVVEADGRRRNGIYGIDDAHLEDEDDDDCWDDPRCRACLELVDDAEDLFLCEDCEESHSYCRQCEDIYDKDQKECPSCPKKQ